LGKFWLALQKKFGNRIDCGAGLSVRLVALCSSYTPASMGLVRSEQVLRPADLKGHRFSGRWVRS
jgi:hypothetical protein